MIQLCLEECPETQLIFLKCCLYFELLLMYLIWGFASIFVLVFPMFSCMIFHWLGASGVRSKENKIQYKMLLCY